MAMTELALRYGQGPVPLKTIAESQGLSESYLEQLFAALRKASLVRSVRGAQGGYELSRPPETISVGDVLRVLEGPLAPVECAILERDDFAHCGNPDRCMTRSVWVRLRQSIEKVVDSINLASLCEEARDQSAQGLMYYI